MPDSTEQNLGGTLKLLADAVDARDNAKLVEAGKILADLTARGRVTKVSESVVVALAALCYDAAGEQMKAKRPYSDLMTSSPLPLAKEFGSVQLAKLYGESLGAYGKRNLREFEPRLQQFESAIHQLQARGEIAPRKDDPTLILTLGITDALLTYDELLQGRRSFDIKGLIESVENLRTAANEIGDSWVSILTELFALALSSSVQRNILNLNLSERLARRLIENDMYELWLPQFQAVQKGLLSGKNLVYSTPAGSGKTLLSYLVSDHSDPQKKTVYLVPTRTLADEIYSSLQGKIGIEPSQIAISTREKTDSDQNLDKISVLVATYEKFDALLRRRRLEQGSVKSVVVDEVHNLSDVARGISLELNLTRLKVATVEDDPQVIALSGMLKESDAVEFSKWMNGELVHEHWKPLDVDEVIAVGSQLFHKDGRVEKSTFRPSANQNDTNRRLEVTAQVARGELVNHRQSLIVVESRKFIQDVCDYLHTAFSQSSFDLDLTAVLDEGRVDRKALAARILSAELIPSAQAKKLSMYVSDGIAFHHAGLRRRYRKIIEEGVKKRVLNTIVSTTTFESGVNMPVSTVVFPFPRGVNGRTSIEVNTYRNLLGRAGRPGFDTEGRSILIALTQDEAEAYKRNYFKSEGEGLDSALWTFTDRDRPPARAAVQSHLLELTTHQDTPTPVSKLVDRAKQTWYWHRADQQHKQKFEAKVNWEVVKLGKYGFLEQPQSGAVRPTESGRQANQTMITPLSFRILINGLRKIMTSGRKGRDFDFLILGLVGIPFEMNDHDDKVSRVPLDDTTSFVDRVIVADNTIGELHQRVQMCRPYATVLSAWIDSVPVSEILDRSKLDEFAEESWLEESLSQDAYWIISSLLSLPGEVVRLSKDERKRIEQLALFCRFGTADELAIELLSLGLPDLGRESALRIVSYAREHQMVPLQITEAEFRSIFPENVEASSILYKELVSKYTSRQPGSSQFK